MEPWPHTRPANSHPPQFKNPSLGHIEQQSGVIYPLILGGLLTPIDRLAAMPIYYHLCG